MAGFFISVRSGFKTNPLLFGIHMRFHAEGNDAAGLRMTGIHVEHDGQLRPADHLH